MAEEIKMTAAEFDNRMHDQIINKAKFCPIDAAELVEEQRPPVLFGRALSKGYVVKVCPNGHGEVFSDSEYGPRLILELAWGPEEFEKIRKGENV
jgi:hypothetical protein